jgi:hypothetical protein
MLHTLKYEACPKSSSRPVAQMVFNDDVFRGSLPLQPPPTHQKARVFCLKGGTDGYEPLRLGHLGWPTASLPHQPWRTEHHSSGLPAGRPGLTRASGRGGRVGLPLPCVNVCHCSVDGGRFAVWSARGCGRVACRLAGGSLHIHIDSDGWQPRCEATACKMGSAQAMPQ